MSTKSELRREIARKRRHLDPHWITDASAQIMKRLKTLAAFEAANTVALYKAITGEVVLEELFANCWELGKHTCIPVFNTEQKIYDLAEITNKTNFRTGNYRIQEPEKPTLISVGHVDLMVVPGVAFDFAGNRLGRGGGYYDRLMEGFCGISVAVAFDFQILPHIPCTTHDIPVDYVVTETNIVKA